MKRICPSEELRKALEVANLLQHVQDIQGEDQKQLDGVFLPICEPIIKTTADQVARTAVQTVWDTQCARDWRTILTTESVRLAAVDADIRTDGVVDQVRVMTNIEYDAFWLGLTAVQKDKVLKRLFRAYCRSR